MDEGHDYLYRLLRKLGLSDFGAETAEVLIQRPVEILLVFLGALILSRMGARLARRSVHGLVSRSVRGEVSERITTRAQTLAGVAASLVRVMVWTVAVLIMLDKVGNAAKEWTRAVVDIAVPTGADLAVAMSAMGEEAAALFQDDDWAEVFLEEPQVLGVEASEGDCFTVRAAAKTRPADKTRVARELRVRIGARLRREGILPLREPVEPPEAAEPTVPSG